MNVEEFEIRSASAIKELREILWPGGSVDKEWNADTFNEIVDMLQSYDLIDCKIPSDIE